MTQLNSYAMTGMRETFVQGATAFRNARDLARKHRDQLIQAANQRARQTEAEVPEAENAVAEAQQEDSASETFVDCEEYAGLQALGTEDDATSAIVNEAAAFPSTFLLRMKTAARSRRLALSNRLQALRQASRQASHQASAHQAIPARSVTEHLEVPRHNHKRNITQSMGNTMVRLDEHEPPPNLL